MSVTKKMTEATMEMPQKTASTHRSWFVRGTHQFEIVGFSVRTALGVSNSVRSAAFESPCTWSGFNPPKPSGRPVSNRFCMPPTG